MMQKFGEKSEISRLTKSNGFNLSPLTELFVFFRWGNVLFIFLEDDVFALKIYLQRQYPSQNLSSKKGV